MNDSFHKLASFLATLSGSVVAVSHVPSSQPTATRLAEVESRAWCSYSVPQLALAAGVMGVVPAAGDEANFFHVETGPVEYRYEDSCGRDLKTGKVYGCGLYEPHASVIGAPSGTILATEESALQPPLCLQGTCALPEASQPAWRWLTGSIQQATTAPSALAAEWLRVQPYWTNRWEEAVRSTQAVASQLPAPRRLVRSAVQIPLVVLREAESVEAIYSPAAEYAAAEVAAARATLPAPLAAALPSADLPATATASSQMEQNGYEPDAPFAADEYFEGEHWALVNADEAAIELFSNPHPVPLANSEADWVEYDWEQARLAEFMAHAAAVPDLPPAAAATSSPVRAFQPLYDEAWLALERNAAAWNDTAAQWREVGKSVEQSWQQVSRRALQTAQELAWEQETRQLDQLFNEYCSLVEFDNLIVRPTPRQSWQAAAAEKLREAGETLLQWADQLEAHVGHGPQLSARPTENR